jgi:hypothetical protein
MPRYPRLLSRSGSDVLQPLDEHGLRAILTIFKPKDKDKDDKDDKAAI